MSNFNYFTELQFNIDNQLAGVVEPQIRRAYRAEFQRIKNMMIADFRNHPVTREIKAGVGASNISGTLGGGSANLFSFIGFEAGSDPTAAIEDVLQTTQLQIGGINKRTINFSIFIPEPRDVFDATPMPWAKGRSWARGIETGISGLGYFIRVKSENSRSGGGIQSPRQVRRSGSRFKNTQYISALIRRYEKEFSNISI